MRGACISQAWHFRRKKDAERETQLPRGPYGPSLSKALNTLASLGVADRAGTSDTSDILSPSPPGDAGNEEAVDTQDTLGSLERRNVGDTLGGLERHEAPKRT